MKIAYGITERDDKSYFTRIGVAFVNKDGSINVKLEYAPMQGQTIQLRDAEPSDNAPAETPKRRGQRQADDARIK